jgi:hypothetical protein
MIKSGDINKVIREIIFPTLKDLGFTKFRGRTAWRYLDEAIWVFNIKAVGAYFSLVTGFPPASLHASLGIYYREFPQSPEVEIDAKDRLPIPKEFHCHTRYGLENIHDQTSLRSDAMLPQERRRTDIWWIDPEGRNVTSVIHDIKNSILEYGIPLLEKPYNARAIQLERRGFTIQEAEQDSGGNGG